MGTTAPSLLASGQEIRPKLREFSEVDVAHICGSEGEVKGRQTYAIAPLLSMLGKLWTVN